MMAVYDNDNENDKRCQIVTRLISEAKNEV